MWYKEWIEVVKTRLIVQAIGFGLILLGYSLLQIPDNAGMSFANWFVQAVLLLTMFSLLFNLDIISREQNRGTLSFLLVRPIERHRIYRVKLLLNLTVSLSLFTLTAIPALAFDMTNLGRNVSLIILGLNVGVLMACAGGLTSAMSRLDPHQPLKLIGSLTLLGTLAFLIYSVFVYADGSYMLTNLKSSQSTNNLLLSLVLFTMSSALYFIGRKAFDTVEV